MLAIQNVRTGKFVYGTDYRYCPPRQRTSTNKMLVYDDLFTAKLDFLQRKCGKDYKIAVLKTVEVKRLIEPPKDYDELKMCELSETD